MSKTKDLFLDHFARLGVFSKVQALMGPSTDNDNDVIGRSQEEGASGKLGKSECPSSNHGKKFVKKLNKN